MQPHRLYSDEVMPEEVKLGFIRAYVTNPDHVYYGHGSIEGRKGARNLLC